MEPDIYDAGWLDGVLGAGGGDALPQDGGGGMAEGNGIFDILGGAVGDIASAAGDTAVGIYTANQAAQAQRQQQAYMAQLANTNSVMGNQTNKQLLTWGAGILLFLIVLRQTAQNR